MISFSFSSLSPLSGGIRYDERATLTYNVYVTVHCSEKRLDQPSFLERMTMTAQQTPLHGQLKSPRPMKIDWLRDLIELLVDLVDVDLVDLADYAYPSSE